MTIAFVRTHTKGQAITSGTSMPMTVTGASRSGVRAVLGSR